MKMTHRERVLKTFGFEQTDRPAFDLMESAIWPSLGEFFSKEYQLNTTEEVMDFLDSDFRWSLTWPKTEEADGKEKKFTVEVEEGYLSDVDSVAELDRKMQLDPETVDIPDFKAIREKYPDHALIFCPGWMPAFYNACRDFGMSNALCMMITDPEIISAYATKMGEYAHEVLMRGIRAGAGEYCDFYWMGDDFSGEESMMLSPELWRKLFRPQLAKQVRTARDAGMKVLFHSCGAVDAVYGDFIDMGINAHCGVQTSARNMNIERLAKEYGGKLVIYGGVDAQTTLVSCTPGQVEEQVRKNINVFRDCGGYVVSNSHHGLPDIKGENIVAMSRAAAEYRY